MQCLIGKFFISTITIYIFSLFIHKSSAQSYIFKDTTDVNITWCTTSSQEQNKCQALAMAVDREIRTFGTDYRKVNCRKAFNKHECMDIIDEGSADITLVDAGEVFHGGRYLSLVPIMQEVYGNGERSYFSVALIKKNSLPDVYSIRDLRGKKACFPGVGSLAGWVIPIYELMRQGGMEVIDCNNHVKSAIAFFGESCAVNSLIDKYNPIGDNPDKFCRLCIGNVPGEKCTTADPYYGFEGAFRCLVEAGDIAFVRHSTVFEMTKNRPEFGTLTPDRFELLCRDGTRRPVEEFPTCNWGNVPSHALVTSSAKDGNERRRIQRFIKTLIQFFGKADRTKPLAPPVDPYINANQLNPYEPNPTYETFSLFHSPLDGKSFNLLFQDNTVDLESLEEKLQSYKTYLSDSLAMILGVRDCPVRKMSLCVTSDAELAKCVKMKSALKAQLLKPDMECHKAHSQINCMKDIRDGYADVAVFDAGDVYTAGLQYELIPFMSEVYNLGRPEYYVVAVAKEEDPDTELTHLKGKYTCHAGINTGAGWIVPMALLISNGWIRSYGCNSVRAAAEYFSKSCVPGALSNEYNSGVPFDNMCDLCHGASYRYCRRDASEAYFGHTGALKCLVEGGGQVAFVKHTTVLENSDGKRKEWWARNRLSGDFELLCPDGRRSQIYDFERCALGIVKANAIVTRGGYRHNDTEINAFINLFLYAQQFYGRKDQDDFSFAMFYSPEPHSDLIFQDATTQLQVIHPSERWYSHYLGGDFLRAKRIVDCHAGVGVADYSLFAFLATLLPIFLLW